VHIGVPAGIGLIRADETENHINYLRLQKQDENDELQLSMVKAISSFKNAGKPVLVVGLSAVKSQLGNLIIRLAEKFKLPVVLTPMAKGIFPEHHKLYAGVLFHALANLVVQTCKEADLVIGVGYDPVELNYEDWMPQVPLLHIGEQAADIDKEEYEEVIDLVGDIKSILENFIQLPVDEKKWNTELLLARKTEMFEKFVPSSNSFGPLAVVHYLRKSLPQNGILTVDVGAHLHLVGQMWETPAPEKLLMTNGWSSMGFAVPAALAAKLCFPGLPVAAILGDGGFKMSVGELDTAKRYNLKIVFVVICDQSLSLIRIKQGKKNFNTNYGTELKQVSVESTNFYFGVPVIKATDSSSYKSALQKAFSADGPVVIEAHVDGSEYDNLVLQPMR
jgi:acetolactate synthase-1/2/3 large subunit